jgi:hypothetical protein
MKRHTEKGGSRMEVKEGGRGKREGVVAEKEL